MNNLTTALELTKTLKTYKKGMPVLTKTLVDDNRVIVSDLDSQLTVNMDYTPANGAYLTDKDTAAEKSKIGLDLDTEKMSVDNYPILEQDKIIESRSFYASDLQADLKSVSYAMAKQDVRYYLNGILFDSDCLVATDGHRLAKTDFNGIPENQTIVRSEGIVILEKLLRKTVKNEVVKIAFGDNFTTFESSDWTLLVRNVDGRYPDYKRVIPKEKGVAVVWSKAAIKERKAEIKVLKPIVKAMESFAPIRIDNSGTLVMPEEGKENHFNVQYVNDVLTRISSDCEVFLGGSVGQYTLIKESDNTVHVIMPMRY